MCVDFVRMLLPPVVREMPELHLFNGPYVVVDGERKECPEGSKRLLAYVALHGGYVGRRVAAGVLWPVGNDVRAAGNLRSALWRLRGAGIDLIESDNYALSLHSGTVIDLDVVCAWAARLIEGRAQADDLDTVAWRSNALELLPGWYDDWVVFERERLRQRVLHGLESLGRHLIHAGRHAEAVEAALAVVSAEPLRESAHRLLIEAHLAEGNVVEACRAYHTYGDLALRELGVQPGEDLALLIARRRRRPVREIHARSRGHAPTAVFPIG